MKTGTAETTERSKISRNSSRSFVKADVKFQKVRLSRRTKKQLSAQISDEKTARRLEGFIPKLARNATTKAYQRALGSGNKVLIAEFGQLIEISPDGTKKIVREIEPSIKMQKGQIIKIK